ncbi:PREDICTED: coiled-coil domain-containing glutamate-rich protein 1 [Elephantulus edwardii]|uniref:coiled-coil domain-containing glutamate-rich protein 1 n=1 Tax=Elephantulus edwardii TaxID=28737 RepID=UPI0003F08EAC|nr:PREDICTED: coiled-coil domain-containing glutamate-rich protein 1 [Elephantulus edwardii]
MTQTLDQREDPLNLGGGFTSSAPVRTRYSCHQRRHSAPIYKRRHRYAPKAVYEPPRKHPKQQQGPGHWFQPPLCPYWTVYSHWGRWGGRWHPPPAACWSAPGQVQMIRVYGLHPLCLCCCSCWGGPQTPAWARPYGRKRRWGRRSRGLRRFPRRSFPRNPPVDLRMLLRPVNLYGWRAPGMRAPRNTTQFIMNQIYEDMRQQEKLERQQAALRAQQAPAPGEAFPEAGSGDDAPPSGCEEDAELQEILNSFMQEHSVVFSPAPQAQTQCPASQQVAEEEAKRNAREEECEEESEEEDEEEEGQDGEGEEDEDEDGEGEEEEEEDGEGEEVVGETNYEKEELEEEKAEEKRGDKEDVQREEENHLPLSTLVGSEEERENFIGCNYFSPKDINFEVSQEALFMVQDINF